ncbi:MAG: FKBP-type peptidyl-prolyl cis-trans isomerase [Saprospiraceae bacterium]|nr:MAG: FKBP-type peptidyl-prolyl cis-trans isomerase [Bacteroidetes bacterium OLB9]MCO6464672.1 FKBP-type peptidyl-prolyl cis-trans isomerase [Saprospiraceae bacterium]MCZ2339314.1 FKBP-type peptidyl-prolyl cis-trans isomerase [Chitinophagales bacterium]
MKYFLIIFTISWTFLSCSKELSPEAQFDQDISIIEQYLKDNNLTANVTPQGIYYIIEVPGSDIKPKITNTVVANYTGYFTDGVVFDSGTKAEFPLYGVIEGWQIGIPKFGVGGKGKLLIPSRYAYGKSERPGRANAVLIFDIELLEIK